MVQVLLGGAILLAVFKVMLPKDSVIDWWATIAFIAVPVIAINGLSFGLRYLGLNDMFAYVGMALYILFPYVFFKSVEDYSSKLAFKYSAVVFCVGVFSAVVVTLVFSILEKSS